MCFEKRACAFTREDNSRKCSIFLFLQKFNCARFHWSNEINAHAHYTNVITRWFSAWIQLYKKDRKWMI